MTPMEDLLRETFAERERDIDGVPLLPTPPRRSRRAGVVLAGAAAAAAVLVGTTIALTGHRSAPADRDTGPSPAAPSVSALRFTPAPIVSAGNRTSAVLTWAPAWTPAVETGRDITSTMQTRYYGWEAGRFAAVTVARGDCRSLRPMSGFHGLRRDGASNSQEAYELCRPLPDGGALEIRVIGAAGDPAAEARRIADSIRTGRRDETALPVSLPAGTVIHRLSVGAVWADRSRREGNITTADGTDVYVGPPPEAPHPNQTVGGRPARVDDYPIGTMVRIYLTPTVWTNVVGDDHDRTVAIAAGLHLGPIPDYSWLG